MLSKLKRDLTDCYSSPDTRGGITACTHCTLTAFGLQFACNGEGYKLSPNSCTIHKADIRSKSIKNTTEKPV